MPLFADKGMLLNNKVGLFPLNHLIDFCWRFSFVVGATIYIGGSNNKQESYRGLQKGKMALTKQRRCFVISTPMFLENNAVVFALPRLDL